MLQRSVCRAGLLVPAPSPLRLLSSSSGPITNESNLLPIVCCCEFSPRGWHESGWHAPSTGATLMLALPEPYRPPNCAKKITHVRPYPFISDADATAQGTIDEHQVGRGGLSSWPWGGLLLAGHGRRECDEAPLGQLGKPVRHLGGQPQGAEDVEDAPGGRKAGYLHFGGSPLPTPQSPPLT